MNNKLSLPIWLPAVIFVSVLAGIFVLRETQSVATEFDEVITVSTIDTRMMPIETPPPSEIPTPKISDTPNQEIKIPSLKSYTNTLRGYSFEYPSEWILVDDDTRSVEYVEVAIQPTKFMSTDDWPERTLNGKFFSVEFSNELGSAENIANTRLTNVTPITISDAIGYSGTFTNEVLGYSETTIYIRRKDGLYIISLPKNSSMVESSILSSFRFID